MSTLRDHALRAPGYGDRRRTTYQRRLWSLDNLPHIRTFMIGPRWMQAFGVEQKALDEVRPPWANRVRAGRKWVLVFTLEEDVRERVLLGREIRPGVVPMWED